jgi:hypothetical protein
MAPPTNRDGYRAYADLRALMNELIGPRMRPATPRL